MDPPSAPQVQAPYRQIRALYEDGTITVYQAYSARIAEAAVREQKLSASPDFKIGRMTWIKPSWCWMMYRSGYSTKDTRQARILALKMRHQDFRTLLSRASLSHGPSRSNEKPVRVQWDPERDAALNVLPYRSIQIGIGGELVGQWVDEWIIAIEDVTERALQLKEFLEKKQGSMDLEELADRGLVPRERVYDIPVELKSALGMEVDEISGIQEG